MSCEIRKADDLGRPRRNFLPAQLLLARHRSLRRYGGIALQLLRKDTVHAFGEDLDAGRREAHELHSDGGSATALDLVLVTEEADPSSTATIVQATFREDFIARVSFARRDGLSRRAHLREGSICPHPVNRLD